MLKAIIIKRLAAVALSVGLSLAVPVLTQKHPTLMWVAGKALPVIVDRAKDRLDARLTPVEEPGDAK